MKVLARLEAELLAMGLGYQRAEALKKFCGRRAQIDISVVGFLGLVVSRLIIVRALCFLKHIGELGWHKILHRSARLQSIAGNGDRWALVGAVG